jgi:hypothetical protein
MTPLDVAEAVSSLVRPALTIMLGGTLCYIAIRSNIQLDANQFLPIVGMVLAFWFGTKTAENALRDKGKVVNNVTQNPSPDSSPAVVNNISNTESVSS